MKAIKLIWLADRLHARTFGRTITGDSYFAIKLGPIPSHAKDISNLSVYLDEDERNYAIEFIASVDNYVIESKKDFDSIVFSKSDLKCSQQIYDLFGKFDQFQLSELSHSFPEWKKFEKAIKQGFTNSFPLDQIDFFAELDRVTIENFIETRIFDNTSVDSEVLEYNKESFLMPTYN